MDTFQTGDIFIDSLSGLRFAEPIAICGDFHDYMEDEKIDNELLLTAVNQLKESFIEKVYIEESIYKTNSHGSSKNYSFKLHKKNDIPLFLEKIKDVIQEMKNQYHTNVESPENISSTYEEITESNEIWFDTRLTNLNFCENFSIPDFVTIFSELGILEDEAFSEDDHCLLIEASSTERAKEITKKLDEFESIVTSNTNIEIFLAAYNQLKLIE